MGEDVDNQVYRGYSYKNNSAMTEEHRGVSGGMLSRRTHISGTGDGILPDGTKTSVVANNSQEAILGNRYKDIRGSDNKYVAGGQTTVARGDINVRVGSLNAAAANLDALVKEGIHKEKAKFEIQRTDYGSIYNSPGQSKSGSPKPCPECSQGKTYPAVNSKITEELDKIQDTIVTYVSGILQTLVNFIAKFLGFQRAPKITVNLDKYKIKFPGLENISFPPPGKCKVCSGSGESPFSYDGNWSKEPGKEKIKQMYEDAGSQLAGAEESMGDGGNYLVEVSRNMVVNVGMAMNKMSDIRIDDKGKKSPLGVTVGEERTYQKQAETPLVEKVHVDDLMGGSLTFIAGNGANFVVGSRGLNFDCFGSCKLNGSRVDIGGAQVNISSKNEVNLISDKRLALEGAMVSMKSSSGQVVMENNLGVSGNAIIAGGAHVEGELCVNHVTAPLELQRTENTPILMGTTQPGVAKIIGYVQNKLEFDAELTVEGGCIYNEAGCVTGKAPVKIKLTVDVPVRSIGADGAAPDESCLYIYPHNHIFRNLPLTLVGSNKDVRMAGAQMEGKSPVPPTEPVNGLKGPPELASKNFNEAEMVDNNHNSQEDITVHPISFADSSPSPAGTTESTSKTTFTQSSYKSWKELTSTQTA